jgi:hypothetical protein
LFGWFEWLLLPLSVSGACSDANERTMEYGKPRKYEEDQNLKEKKNKNMNDLSLCSVCLARPS